MNAFPFVDFLNKQIVEFLMFPFGAVHKIRNAVFRYFRPPPPFVTQNRTNPYISTEVRNKSLTPPQKRTYFVNAPFSDACSGFPIIIIFALCWVNLTLFAFSFLSSVSWNFFAFPWAKITILQGCMQGKEIEKCLGKSSN